MSICLLHFLEHTGTTSKTRIVKQTSKVTLGGLVWEVMWFSQGLNRQILSKLFNSLKAYLTWHSKMYVIRFDISLYHSPSNNNTISKLRSYITKELKTHYKSRVEFGWVREQNNTDNKCHYHCFVLLNGHTCNSTNKTFSIVRKAMSLVIDVTFYFPENCSYMVIRNELSTLQAVLYRLSYLAKNATKENNPALVKSYYLSRLKPK